ncbi:MAG: GNAT family N-acetyltransferase [Candidatus Micrarchaeia archaeon]
MIITAGFLVNPCGIRRDLHKRGYRGKGIGRKLLKSTIASVKRYFQREKLHLRRIYLFVLKYNAAAIKLHESEDSSRLLRWGTSFMTIAKSCCTL